MKLYTEEQVRKVISEAMFYHDTVDAHVSKLTPISLPGNEEIKAFAMGYYDNNGADYHVELGAKYVIEQIKNKQ